MIEGTVLLHQYDEVIDVLQLAGRLAFDSRFRRATHRAQRGSRRGRLQKLPALDVRHIHPPLFEEIRQEPLAGTMKI